MRTKFASTVLAFAMITGPVQAQVGLPVGDSPIRLIIPFSAGAGVDTSARSLGRAMAASGKRAVIVDNRAGADGLIGAKAVMAAPADGLTAMVTSNSVPTLLPALRKNRPFDPASDFTPVCAVTKAPMYLWIRSTLPFKNVKEFVEAAKASPGEYTFAYATGLTRLGLEWFTQKADIKLRGIPYKATPQTLIDLISGNVDLVFADASTAMAHHQSGKIRPLLIADSHRTTTVPEAPTADEVGFTGYHVSVWTGVYLPPKAPREVVAAWQSMLKSASADAAVREGDKSNGRVEMMLCGDEFVRFQTAEIVHWNDIVNKARIERE